MSDKILIGDRLRSLRKKQGKNQEVVASDIGISRARYSHYENNHVEPDIELIKKLAVYFNVTTDYLLGGNTDVDLMSDDEIDEELKELMSEMNVWFKDEPKDRKEKLKMLRKAFRIVSED